MHEEDSSHHEVMRRQNLQNIIQFLTYFDNTVHTCQRQGFYMATNE